MFRVSLVSGMCEEKIEKASDKKIRENSTLGMCAFSNIEVRPIDRCFNWRQVGTGKDIWQVFGKNKRYPEITDMSPTAKRSRQKEVYRRVIDHSEQDIIGVV